MLLPVEANAETLPNALKNVGSKHLVGVDCQGSLPCPVVAAQWGVNPLHFEWQHWRGVEAQQVLPIWYQPEGGGGGGMKALDGECM